MNPTQSQPTALPTPFQTALKLADEISRLDLESITKERVQMTILIQRAIEQRGAALVAENKRLREALEKAQSFISNGREIAESGHETECAAEFAGSYCERLLARIRAALAKEDV